MIDTNDQGTREIDFKESESLKNNTLTLSDTDSKSLQKTRLLKYDSNPFVDDDLLLQLSGLKNVRYTETSRNAIVDTQTGEYTPAILQVVKTTRADKEQFVKLYTTHLKVFFELSSPTFKLLQYVLNVIQMEAKNTDLVDLSLEDAISFFSKRGEKISRAVWFRGLKELIEKQFLAKNRKFSSKYFINPKLFFNGDRIDFIERFELEKKQEVITKEEYKLKEKNND